MDNDLRVDSSPIPLWAHQEQNVERMLMLLARRMVAADCSETGTGKTVTALTVASRFQLPFCVVCPKSLKSHWTFWTQELGVLNCLGVYGWEETRRGKHPEIFDSADWFKNSGIEHHLVIFDEAHRSKSRLTLNSKMVNRASAQGIYLLLLSATLIQSVLDLGGLSFPLKLVEHQRYWFDFARQFGAGVNRRFSPRYEDQSTPEQIAALRALLDKIRVRTRRSEITQLLPVLNQTDLLDSAQLPLIRAQYEALDAAVAELEARQASSAQILTQRLHGRQAIELLKVPMFVEEAENHLEAGFKVALFFNFSASIKEARSRLGISYPVGVIDGTVSGDDRTELIAAFSKREGLRALVLNVAAGGEGINLQDTCGGQPRVALLSPPESASQLIQACGRIGGRLGAKSVGLNRILFVANTLEETVYRNVAKKIRRLENLNDADLAWRRTSTALLP